MSSNLDAVQRDAMALPVDQRVTLAHRILESTEPAVDPLIESVWEAEIVERIRKLDAGETATHSTARVMEELDQRLEQ